MMEAVNIMERCYERVPSYGKQEADWKMSASNERLAWIERKLPYVVHVGITITLDDMARAAYVGLHRSSIASSS